MPTATQALSYRRDLEALVGVAEREAARAIAGTRTGKAARAAAARALPDLYALFGQAAATAAADWYDEVRYADKIPGAYRAVAAPLAADAGLEALAGWAVGPMFAATPDLPAAQNLLAGGLQRRVVDVSRATITANTYADPAADGWQRVSSGKGCAFCAMLAGRGAVYSEATADFASHDHCHCTAVPAWTGQPRPVKPYTPTTRTITDADRARVRDWLKANPT